MVQEAVHLRQLAASLECAHDEKSDRTRRCILQIRSSREALPWYEEHLGLRRDSSEGVAFRWRDTEEGKEGLTALGIFDKNSKYFDPSRSQFMLNFRVADLDALLAVLRAEGVEVEEKIEEYDYGRFGWIMDPEGNRI